MSFVRSRNSKTVRRYTVLVRRIARDRSSSLTPPARDVMAPTYWAICPTPKAPAQAFRHTYT